MIPVHEIARLAEIEFSDSQPRWFPAFVPDVRHLLNPADVDHSISRPDLINLVHRQIPVSRRSFGSVADVRRYVGAGATAVLSGVQRYSPSVRGLCDRLTAATGVQAHGVAYRTPKGDQCFPSHWDNDSAVHIQVSGTELFRIFPPVVADTAELVDPWILRGFTPDELAALAGRPYMTVILNPGDALWIPRGWVHNSVARDEPSYRLTIGLLHPEINPLMLSDAHA
jgi:ribosomal protein L16 Arg81 hydroxylase